MPTCPNCRAILMGPACSCGWRRPRPEPTSRVEEMLHVGGGSCLKITAVPGRPGQSARRLTFSTTDRRGAVEHPNTVVSLNIGGQVDNFTISNDEAIALMAYLSDVTAPPEPTEHLPVKGEVAHVVDAEERGSWAFRKPEDVDRMVQILQAEGRRVASRFNVPVPREGMTWAAVAEWALYSDDAKPHISY